MNQLENRTVYYFNAELARQYGIVGAILLQDLAFGVKRIKNLPVEKHWHRDRFYISQADIHKRHPYLSLITIKRTLAKLREQKVIEATKPAKGKWHHVLHYRFLIPEVYKMALSDNGTVSFVIGDASKYGIKEAVLLRHLCYTYEQRDNDTGQPTVVSEPLVTTDAWRKLSPAEISEHYEELGGRNDLGSLATAFNSRWIARALTALCNADPAALLRRRDHKKGSGGYVYKLVETWFNEARLRDVTEPTELYESSSYNTEPSEIYDKHDEEHL